MKQSRRNFIKMTGMAGGAALTNFVPQHQDNANAGPAPTQPNILYIFADQMRRDSASCYGDPNIITTNLDAMTTVGLKFNNCIASSPVCTPYRGQLQSGLFPSRTNVWQNNDLLPAGEYCIAEAFADAGYSTGYIGKWHIDGSPKPGPVTSRQGWQYWAGFNRGHLYNPGTGIYFTGSDPQNPVQNNVPGTVYEPDHQKDLAISFIEDQKTNGTAPWILMLSWGPPHTPYGQVAQSYKDMFDSATLTLRPNVPVAQEANARSSLADYYAQIKSLDDYLGEINQALIDNGFIDDTIIIFTADHGDMHRSQGQTFKSKPWEESCAVPFVCKWPNGIVNPNREVNEMIQTVDMYPTLCALAGVMKPPNKDGKDLSHLFLDQAGVNNDSVYLSIGSPTASNPWRGVRTAQHTFAIYPKTQTGYILYDNIADPYQLNNLVDLPENEVLQNTLKDKMLEWMELVEDPLFDLFAEPPVPGTPIDLVNWDFNTPPFGNAATVVVGWDAAPGTLDADGKNNATQGIGGTGCGVCKLNGGLMQLTDHSILENHRYVLKFLSTYVTNENDVEAVLFFDDNGTPVTIESQLIDLTSSYVEYELEFTSVAGQAYIGKKVGVYFLHIGVNNNVVRLEDVSLEHFDLNVIEPEPSKSKNWNKYE